MVHILAVANRMIEIRGFAVSNLKLQKLLYYVYGVNLVLNSDVELSEGPQAWDYGPVFPKVYQAFKRFGSKPIRELAEISPFGLNGTLAKVPTSSKLDVIISDVHNIYGDVDDFRLVQLTHQQGSPWEECYDPDKRKTKIRKRIISKYFQDYVVA